eukprot:359412-Chlamydomonas_euryale.AAC.1
MLPSWRYNDDGTAPSSEQQAIAAAAMALRSKEPSEPPSTSGDFYRYGSRSTLVDFCRCEPRMTSWDFYRCGPRSTLGDFCRCERVIPLRVGAALVQSTPNDVLCVGGKMASGGCAISVTAASLGSAALADAPKPGRGYFGDGTPRCRRPYFARLANAARALQWNHLLKALHDKLGLLQVWASHYKLGLLQPPITS